MMRKDIYYIVSTIWSTLQEAKKNNNKKAFDKSLVKIFPELKNYTKSRIKSLENKGKLPKNKYKSGDFISKLYLLAYENIDAFNNNQDFTNWLFITLDNLLEETIVFESKKAETFENIDAIGKVERDSMEEIFSVDADGDLMMIEEFNDPSYPKFDYTLDKVFVDNDAEKQLIDKLNKEYTPAELHSKIESIVDNINDDKRIIFELNTIYQIAPEQIATIRKIDVQKVNDINSEIKKNILDTLCK